MFWMESPYEIHTKRFLPFCGCLFTFSAARPLKPEHFPSDEASSNRSFFAACPTSRT